LAPDFPTIDVEARETLADADAEEGLRPREVNTPEPEPEDDPVEDDDNAEGGGKGKGPKGRADARVADMLTEQQRAGIRSAGARAAAAGLQAKLVARYGVPAAQAALLWEREIKAQHKTVKPTRVAPAVVEPVLDPKKSAAVAKGRVTRAGNRLADAPGLITGYAPTARARAARIRRGTKTADAVAAIIDACKAGEISMDEARTQLLALGVSSAEIAFLLSGVRA
jgi:hypothetical protein